jgi:tetratricopeptide (TPR) repeat protein
MRRLLGFSWLACVLLASWGEAAPPKATQPSRPRWLSLREALMRKDYQQLTTALEEAQQAFENSVLNEDWARDAFRAFNVADPSLEPLLSGWIAASPKSYVARAARGQYFEASARAARGRAWAADTTSAQMKGMSDYFEKATADCEAALKIRPRLLVCQVLLIDILKKGGPSGAAKVYATEALRAEPASFLIRQAYMHSLTPRWGGSYEEMTELARASQAYVTKNPRLKLLLGYVAWDRGNMLVPQGRPRESLPYFAEALKSGDDPLFLSDRGGAYYRLKQYEQAMADLTRALEVAADGWSYSIVMPHHALLYDGACLYYLGKQGDALSYLHRAEEVDSLDAEVVQWKQFLEAKAKK